ncbi:MAG TPA: ABC transporter permease [Trueperaceae bacterium]|nr:ABC transporter permease [Trueperaceae bacterium]
MIAYVLRRLVQGLGAILGVITVTFILTYIVPVNPAQMIAGPSATPEVVQRIGHELGLDQPLPVRYAHYVWNLVHFDMGRSYAQRTQVSELVASHLPVTLKLMLTGIACELLLGIPIGILSSVAQGSWWDRGFTLFAFVGVSTPQFVVGLILLYLFGYRVPWFPLGGYGNGDLVHYVLPALSVGFAGAGWYARVLRSSLVDVLRQDYLRTARAKGVMPRAQVFRHALRNAMLPVIALVGLDLGVFMGGVIVVEQVFALPGLGQMMWQAIQVLDIPVIMGGVLMTAIFVVFGNLVADMIYPLLDPRIQYH